MVIWEIKEILLREGSWIREGKAANKGCLSKQLPQSKIRAYSHLGILGNVLKYTSHSYSFQGQREERGSSNHYLVPPALLAAQTLAVGCQGQPEHPDVVSFKGYD